MSQPVKPVAPSKRDIRAQLEGAIKVIEGDRDKIKNDQNWEKIKEDKKNHPGELDRLTTELTKNLHAAKDLEKQKELILAHQAVFQRGVDLDRQDREYEAKLKPYEDEINKL